MRKLIVIYYHDIVDDEKGYSYQKVEEAKFESQMKYLRNNGYNTILFEDLNRPLPDKAVLLTFDDGFRTVYKRAVPIMRRYGIKGNIFIPTRYVEEDHPHFMTWTMLKELCDTGDFSVAAHTHNHVDIRGLSESEMKAEVDQSDSLLKIHLNIQTNCFCMPYGKYDAKSIVLLKKMSNYKFIFASFYGHGIEREMSAKLLPRIGISNDDSIELFKKKLEGNLNWKGVVQKGRLFIANCKGERISQYDIE